jgi:hypothetical protein
MMCHSHHRRTIPPAAVEPRRDPALRASDSDREEIVTELRHHGAAGRLDVDELEQRVGAAYSARTNGELARLLEDLPRRRVVPAPARHGDDWRAFMLVNVLLVAIWAASGAGYFWPAWVMAWWGFALVIKSGPALLRLR